MTTRGPGLGDLLQEAGLLLLRDQFEERLAHAVRELPGQLRDLLGAVLPVLVKLGTGVI
jgi:hypothetical protein